jgi:hypothetical protein
LTTSPQSSIIKEKEVNKMAKWVVAKEHLDGDYEVYKICHNEKQCKEYISNQPKAKQKEFFYFKDLTKK